MNTNSTVKRYESVSNEMHNKTSISRDFPIVNVIVVSCSGIKPSQLIFPLRAIINI